MRQLMACIAIMVLFSLTSSRAVFAQDDKLRFEIRSLKSEYQVGEPLLIEVRIVNVGNKAIPVLNTFGPEGWHISFKIIDSKGVKIYWSGGVKMEMTSGFLKVFYLEPDYFMGTLFTVESKQNTVMAYSRGNPIPAGEYTIHAEYINERLKRGYGLDFLAGSWEANIIHIKILESK